MFKEISLLFGMVMSVIGGPSYLSVPVSEINFDWKTGDNTPILYYLATKNTYEKARFDIYSDSIWVDVYYEGNPNLRSVTVTGGNTINFILKIIPTAAPDGQNIAEIKIDAVKPNDSLIFETKKIKVTLNKNIASATPAVSTTVTPSIGPVPSVSITPVISASTTPAISVSKTPVPTTKPSQTPIISSTTSPAVSVSISPQPLDSDYPTPGEATREEVRRNIFVRFWSYLVGIFD